MRAPPSLSLPLMSTELKHRPHILDAQEGRSHDQMCYYQAGIGTYTGYVPLTSNFLSHIQQTHIHLSRRDLHLKETRLRRRLGSQSSRQSSLSSLSHLTLPQVQDGYKFCMYRSYSALSLIPSSDAQLPQGRQDLPLWFLQRCIHRTCFGRHAS